MTTARYIQAVRYATLAHAGQKRKAPKGKEVPYIVHPLEASAILAEAGITDEDILIAALLHDALEDTNTTKLDIELLFGREVLAIVSQVTDDPSLSRADQKRQQVKYAPHKTRAAKLVKLADKTSNMRDLLRTPPGWSVSKVREYTNHAREVATGLNSKQGLPLALTSAFWKASQDVLDWCTERELNDKTTD